jgi:predicted nucleic acid-binding protein
MRRVVIDTNLYIDWLNAGRHEAVLFQRDAVKYLSAVVMLELYAGAFFPRDRRIVRGLVAAFERADRILVPSGAVWEDAGQVLRALQESRGSLRTTYPSLVNDVLIALSARSVGASVVTSNARDFGVIRKIRPFKLTVVSAVGV